MDVEIKKSWNNDSKVILDMQNNKSGMKFVIEYSNIHTSATTLVTD